MSYNDYPIHDKQNDSDILFSRSVKAGKRMYYLDVKRDRKGELYISMTESKRMKDQGDPMHPIFEKHKIFLYHEDLERFANAFSEVADYTRNNAQPSSYSHDWNETDNAHEAPNDPLTLKTDFEF